jgi:hypothetical protein
MARRCARLCRATQPFVGETCSHAATRTFNALAAPLLCAEGVHRVIGSAELRRPRVDEIDTEALEVTDIAGGEGGFPHGGDTGDLHVADF